MQDNGDLEKLMVVGSVSRRGMCGLLCGGDVKLCLGCAMGPHGAGFEGLTPSRGVPRGGTEYRKVDTPPYGYSIGCQDPIEFKWGGNL